MPCSKGLICVRAIIAELISFIAVYYLFKPEFKWIIVFINNTAQKMKFPINVFSVNIIFTEEILNGKLHFCAV